MTKSIIQKKITTRKNQKQLFGKGASGFQIIFTLLLFFLGVYFSSNFINQNIMKTPNEISISLGAAWIHLLMTTAFWSFGWMVSFIVLQMIFPVVANFFNPKQHPEHDFITKLYTQCNDFQQVCVSIFILFLLVFSWVIMYMHSQVTNAG